MKDKKEKISKKILKVFVGVPVLLIPYYVGYYAANNKINNFLLLLLGIVTLLFADIYGRMSIIKSE